MTRNRDTASSWTGRDQPFKVDGFAVDTARGANWRPQYVWVDPSDALALASLLGSANSLSLTAPSVLIVLAVAVAVAVASIGVYRLAAKASGGAPSASLPLWWMVAVVVGTVLAVAVLTLIPARAGARRPVAEVLRAE